MGQSPSVTQWHATVVNPEPRHIVRLAATPITQTGVSSTFAAYHTSICIDSVELSFDHDGICVDKEWASHYNPGDGDGFSLEGPAEVREMGVSSLSAEELMGAMQPHFQAGSYDLLCKNCNSFTDCALSYLLGKRLDEGFNSLDRLACFAESNFGFIGLLTGYTPNPKAALFVKDHTIHQLKSLSGHLEKRVVLSAKALRKSASGKASEKTRSAKVPDITVVKKTLESSTISSVIWI